VCGGFASAQDFVLPSEAGAAIGLSSTFVDAALPAAQDSNTEARKSLRELLQRWGSRV